MSNLIDLLNISYSVSEEDVQLRIEKLKERIIQEELFTLYIGNANGYEVSGSRIIFKNEPLSYFINEVNNVPPAYNHHFNLPERYSVLNKDQKFEIKLQYNLDLEHDFNNFYKMIFYIIRELDLQVSLLPYSKMDLTYDKLTYQQWEVLFLKIKNYFIEYSKSQYTDEFLKIIECSIENMKQTKSLIPFINIHGVFNVVFGNDRYPEQKTFIYVNI